MIMSHVGDAAFCPGRKPISPGHVGDTAFLPGQKKTHITTFGALGGLAHSEYSAVYSEHSALQQYTSMTPHTVSNR